MRLGKRTIWSLALACLVAGSCGLSRTPTVVRSAPAAPSQPSIALSVLASSVYVVDPSTGVAHSVADGLTDFQSGFAAWSPDHRFLAYGDNAILVVDASTGDGRVLAKGPSLSMPAWSPDGTRIAYGDGRDLWVTDATRLNATYLQLPLSLAPLEMDWGSGNAIAFEGLTLACHLPFGCTSTSKSDIYTVFPNGAGLQRITRFGDAEAPKWSPDATKILFVRRLSGDRRELWVVNQDGSDAHRLATEDGVLSADWSPDGREIVMACRGKRTDTVQMYEGSAGGSGLRALGRAVKGAEASVDW